MGDREMNENPRVYVTQEAKRADYVDAYKYGDVIFLATEEYKAEPTDGKLNMAIRIEIADKFKDYRPGVDFLLPSGSPISMLLASMVLGRMSRPMDGVKHKVLKWNNQQRRYEICLV
jgi:hypothetical protein